MLLWTGLPLPSPTTGREDKPSVDEARHEGHQQRQVFIKRHSWSPWKANAVDLLLFWRFIDLRTAQDRMPPLKICHTNT
jgi:hypothetical protein